MNTVRILSLAFMPAFMLGCARGINERIDVLGAPPLPAFRDSTDPRPTDEPSVNGLDRSHWPTVTVIVPGRQVEHNPTYVDDVSLTRATPAQRGAYPTARDALNLTAPLGAQLLEMVVGVPHAAAQIPLAPVRAITTSTPQRSPRLPYERSPLSDQNGGIE